MKNGAEAIHLATGLVVGFPPCPWMDYFKEFIETRYGVPVVVGTHPIPEHYVQAHKELPSKLTVLGAEALMTTPEDKSSLRVIHEEEETMKSPDESRWNIDTKCIHAGPEADPLFGSVAPPIYQTSTFIFRSPEEGAARFAGDDPGYIYTRMGNPTIAMLEATVAALEEGETALATSSGMSAASTVFFALLSAGDHVVCSASVYGPSRVVLERDFSRFGVDATMVDTSDLANIRNAITDRTRLVYVETPANPTLAITDLAGAAEIAHEAGALLVVDNTFLSPVLQKPFRFGADIVLHSVTKFLNGHADVVGGVLVFRDDDLMKKVRGVLHYLGGTMDPHQAWLVLRGIKTLAMRVRTGSGERQGPGRPPCEPSGRGSGSIPGTPRAPSGRPHQPADGGARVLDLL